MATFLLTLNSGSSSVKFSLFQVEGEQRRIVAGGQVEGLGVEPVFQAKTGGATHVERLPGNVDHRLALISIMGWIEHEHPGAAVLGVGHRVVHGGMHFDAPVVIDADVLSRLAALVPLAPLHQPHNLAGIAAAQAEFPEALQVACFDTAFHRTQPFTSQTFGLPRAMFEEGIRRYGFHGLSYEFIAGRLREMAPSVASGRVVVAHLGNGASLCGMDDGRSVATTMGFTALDGMPMGTRCGQLDPGVLLFLMSERKLDHSALETLLYKQSGLKGLSGVSADMRELEASDSPQAQDAISYFVARVQREVGSIAAALGGLDALVFTGGIGENSWRIRSMVLEKLQWMGLRLDAEANKLNGPFISDRASSVPCLVIRANEEEMIAAHTWQALQNNSALRAA